jgi:hypothetical protein
MVTSLKGLRLIPLKIILPKLNYHFNIMKHKNFMGLHYFPHITLYPLHSEQSLLWNCKEERLMLVWPMKICKVHRDGLVNNFKLRCGLECYTAKITNKRLHQFWIMHTIKHIIQKVFTFHPLWYRINGAYKKLNSMTVDRKRTIMTEQPPLVSEVSDNLCGYRLIKYRVIGTRKLKNVLFLYLGSCLMNLTCHYWKCIFGQNYSTFTNAHHTHVTPYIHHLHN